MKIGSEQNFAAADLAQDFTRRAQPEKSFATVLEAERVKAENEAARGSIMANQESKGETLNKDDIEFIREHGMRAYAEQMHIKKMEELREKILEAMGLTEEMLEEMPPEQRLTVEKLVAQEIKKRMAADSMTNGGSGPETDGNRQAAAGSIGPGNLLAAQVLAGDPGALVGMVLSESSSEKALSEEKRSEQYSG